VINRGGVVEIYGSVGSITGTERTQILFEELALRESRRVK